MTFLIEYLDEPAFIEDDETLRYARVIFGDFEERFTTPLGFWTEDDYSSQWVDGVRRLVHEKRNSALITSIYERTKQHGIGWFPLYVVEDEVAIQDHVVLPEAIGPDFFANPYDYVGERDPDEQLSEWRVPVSSLRNFLDSRS